MANRICPGCKVRNAEYLKRAKKWLCEPCALALGFLVKCQGEAHSNPLIDHCGVCVPRWGVHEVRNVADYDAAIAKAEADAEWYQGAIDRRDGQARDGQVEGWIQDRNHFQNVASQLRHEQRERAALQQVHFAFHSSLGARVAIIPSRGYLELPR